MSYKVQLTYFRQTGKFLTATETTSELDSLLEIWEEIDDLRRLGQLPDLRPGAGRDLLVLIDVPDHPLRQLHLVVPPFIDEDDVTPSRTPTGEMMPLVRVPLAEIPRTTTRDIQRPVEVEEVTPVDVPIPRRPRTDEPR